MLVGCQLYEVTSLTIMLREGSKDLDRHNTLKRDHTETLRMDTTSRWCIKRKHGRCILCRVTKGEAVNAQVLGVPGCE